MFEKHFSEYLTVRDQRDLRALFGTDTVYLKSGASVAFLGSIALSPNVIFDGACELRGPVEIESGCMLSNVHLGQKSRVRAFSVISDMRAGSGNLFGPHCFVRDGCRVGDDVILGAHVEAARSIFASGVKVSHRAFIGDADVGTGTILGAGTVFCNYIRDGGRQHTKIGADVTVGSGTMLVAPLSIGDGATIGAGAVVTKDVPAGARIIQKR